VIFDYIRNLLRKNKSQEEHSPLRQLIEEELENQDKTTVDPQRLYDVLGEANGSERIADGIFVHAIGLYGDWSEKEKKQVKRISDSRYLRTTQGHGFAKLLTGRDNPFVEQYEPVNKIIDNMKPGDLTRVCVGKEEYFLVDFPAEMPSIGYVLFVK
jgi:hypothetical protein